MQRLPLGSVLAGPPGSAATAAEPGDHLGDHPALDDAAHEHWQTAHAALLPRPNLGLLREPIARLMPSLGGLASFRLYDRSVTAGVGESETRSSATATAGARSRAVSNR